MIIGQILLLNQLFDQCVVARMDLLGRFIEICVVDAHAPLVRILFFVLELDLLANLDEGFL